MVLFVVLLVLIVIVAGILSYVLLTGFDAPPTRDSGDIVSIASWNLQNFSPSKAENETLLRFYVDTLDDYDVFVIQEINDPGGDAVQSFAAQLPMYSYVISDPAGQGTSKEQYAIFYKNDIELIDAIDWTLEEQHNFERPPFEATFRVANWTFTLYTIHIKVGNVPQELSNLEILMGAPSQDTILLGDLNADGDQYYTGILHHFLGWHWLITSDMDTTVAKSSNAYDRIVVNDAAKNNFIGVGIMDEVDASQSDHYLVYALFTPNET